MDFCTCFLSSSFEQDQRVDGVGGTWVLAGEPAQFCHWAVKPKSDATHLAFSAGDHKFSSNCRKLPLPQHTFFVRQSRERIRASRS